MKQDDVGDNGAGAQPFYRLPWSLHDNPIGWVEITDPCNITCKGCYRTTLAGHKSLDDIKDEILFLQRWRNINNVHLAGGEPLIHPDIVEIVRLLPRPRAESRHHHQRPTPDQGTAGRV